MSKICKKCDVLETNDNNDYCGICANELVADLEAKLAESEEHNKMLEEHKFYADNIIQAYADKCKKSNQDKISFAVEQLEKFRDIMEKLNENNSGYIIRFSSMRDREKFHEALDNQIEELKKEMK